MLTRCPGCAKNFRITPEQLKARHGRVRCGECQEVFNALETLVEEAPAPPLPATPLASPPAAAQPILADAVPASPPAAIPPAVPLAPTFSDIATIPDVVVNAGTDDENLSSEPLPDALVTAPLKSPEIAPSAVVAKPIVARFITTESLADYEPSFDSMMPALPSRRRVWPWAVGIIAAMLVLALQAMHNFRVEIAATLPEVRPALLAFCDVLGCKLPLPSKVDLVGIENSDLHPESGDSGRLQLVAMLKNRATFAQEYPYLELTLTNAADQALLRKMLAPADYLPKDKPALAGFAANSDLAVNLRLEVKELAPVGYRLYVFYP